MTPSISGESEDSIVDFGTNETIDLKIGIPKKVQDEENKADPRQEVGPANPSGKKSPDCDAHMPCLLSKKFQDEENKADPRQEVGSAKSSSGQKSPDCDAHWPCLFSPNELGFSALKWFCFQNPHHLDHLPEWFKKYPEQKEQLSQEFIKYVPVLLKWSKYVPILNQELWELINLPFNLFLSILNGQYQALTVILKTRWAKQQLKKIALPQRIFVKAKFGFQNDISDSELRELTTDEWFSQQYDIIGSTSIFSLLQNMIPSELKRNLLNTIQYKQYQNTIIDLNIDKRSQYSLTNSEIYKGKYKGRDVTVFFVSRVETLGIKGIFSLKHDNLLPLLTSGSRGTKKLLVFPQYDMNLATFLSRLMCTPEELKIILESVAGSVLKALQFLASENVAHGNIKLQNILIKLNPFHVVLADFRHAKRAVSDTDHIKDFVDFGFMMGKIMAKKNLQTNYSALLSKRQVLQSLIQFMDFKSISLPEIKEFPFNILQLLQDTSEVLPKSVETYKLTDFKISDSILGSGTSSQVFSGTDKRGKPRGTDKEGNPVAIKKIGKVLIPKILSEVQILQSLNHPNVISLEFVAEDEHHVYLGLEKCTGSLVDFLTYPEAFVLNPLQSRKEKSFEEWMQYMHLQIVIGVLKGLSAIHEQGIMHRDIKPGNILILDEIVKIGDFGVSKQVQNKAGDVGYHTYTGTLRYIAPEVSDGQEYGMNCDMWSAGMVFAQLFGISITPGGFELTEETKEEESLITLDRSIDQDIVSNLPHTVEKRSIPGVQYDSSVIPRRTRTHLPSDFLERTIDVENSEENDYQWNDPLHMESRIKQSQVSEWKKKLLLMLLASPDKRASAKECLKILESDQKQGRQGSL